MSGIQYPRGFFFNENKSEKTAEWKLASVRILKKSFMEWVNTQPGDDIVLDVVKSNSSDGYYVKVNTWRPNKETTDNTQNDNTNDGIPF